MARPNILLIVLDSVRARNLSLYGHYNQTTPFLDEFAKTATVYTQARSPGIHSVASHVSLFTGFPVAEHRLHDQKSILEPDNSIWEALSKEFDYDTGLFTPNVIVSETSNLATLFDHVDGPLDARFEKGIHPSEIENRDRKYREFLVRSVQSDHPLKSIANGIHSRFFTDRAYNSATDYIGKFLDWTERREKPWAACINLMNAHYPYFPTSDFDEWGGKRLKEMHKAVSFGPQAPAFMNGDNPWWMLEAFESLYDGAILQLDSVLRELLSRFESDRTLDETLLVITSDHGEGFGEHSRLVNGVRMVDHSWGIHEVLTHVPLVVKEPGQGEGTIEDSLSTPAMFPAVVRQAVEGGGDPSFVAPSGETLSTTYRIADKDSQLLNGVKNPGMYLGPWHARYTDLGGGRVKKQMVKAGYPAITLEISNAQESCVVDGSDAITIEDIENDVSRVDIGRRNEDHELDDAVIDRLNDLGYVE